MKAWGLGATIKQSEKCVEVEPENEQPVRLFMALATQWKYMPLPVGLGAMIMVRTGIDYAALPAVAGAYGITLDAEVLSGIQQLEHATIDVDQAKRKQRR